MSVYSQGKLAGPIMTRLDEKTDKKLRKEAEHNDLSVAAYLRMLIRFVAEHHGFPVFKGQKNG